MSDSMIERVARTLAFDHHRTEDNWQEWSEAAQAVIEALREPTEEMVNAAYENCHEANSARFDSNIDFADGVWRAMIDAALKQKSPAAD